MSETAETGVDYQPRFTPALEILEPFTGTSPAGEDILFSGFYETLKEVARADDPGLMGGDAFKPKGGWKVADWRQIEHLATECLTRRSKDFRVACYLARALAENRGLPGMREGLWLLVEVQQRFWDVLYPEVDKVRDEASGQKVRDAGPRAQDLAAVLQHFAAKIAALPPCAPQADEASIEAALRPVRDLETELERLEAVIDEKYTTAPVTLATVRDPLRAYQSSFEAAREARAREDEERGRRALEAAQQSERDAQRAEQERQEAAQRAVEHASVLGRIGLDPAHFARFGAGDPASREDVVRRVAALAHWLRRQDPLDPAGYLLPLTVAWAGDVARGRIPAPPPEAREQIASLALSAPPAALIDSCLQALVLPYGRDWWDPVFLVDAALARTGPQTEAVRSEWNAAVAHRVAKDPKSVEAVLADGSNAADETTRTYLRERLDERTALEGPGGGAAEYGIPAAVREQAEALWQQKQPAIALRALQEAIETATFERERFVRRLELAEICAEKGLPNLAEPILRDLAAAVDRRGLAAWEDPLLLTRLYAGICAVARSGAGTNDEKERRYQEAFEKLCLLDPGRVLGNR